jgi:hypothetical protein
LAIISVDDDKIRRDVQYDMPAILLNAGTGDLGTYQASAHNFLDHACAACISRADLSVSSPEARLAARLELPLQALRPFLHRPEPLPSAILATARLSPDERAATALIPGRDLLQQFCDKLQLPDSGPAVSVPMLSAAAGVLLAAQIARHACSGSTTQHGQVVRTSIRKDSRLPLHRPALQEPLQATLDRLAASSAGLSFLGWNSSSPLRGPEHD